jgi:non-canonical purine NTP pyrophosphatase (RdgB/HAM1 family)
MNAVFVTGNSNKAKYFSELIGLKIDHMAANTDEIQSLELREVTEAKARSAYRQIKRPVIVEDVSLQINSFGRLPGTFIKWFIDEIGLEKICSMLNGEDRQALARCGYGYFDGRGFHYFEGSLKGHIVTEPKGDSGFGWNAGFVPEGTELTLGEMDDATFKKYYLIIKPINELREFLSALDSGKA